MQGRAWKDDDDDDNDDDDDDNIRYICKTAVSGFEVRI